MSEGVIGVRAITQVCRSDGSIRYARFAGFRSIGSFSVLHIVAFDYVCFVTNVLLLLIVVSFCFIAESIDAAIAIVFVQRSRRHYDDRKATCVESEQ